MGLKSGIGNAADDPYIGAMSRKHRLWISIALILVLIAAIAWGLSLDHTVAPPPI